MTGEIMSATRARLALVAAGAALAGAGLLSGGTSAQSPVGLSAGDTRVPLAPTTSVAPSYAPPNPVDCTDPNNVVNCQTPPIDSPMVQGTAPPGSPFRD